MIHWGGHLRPLLVARLAKQSSWMMMKHCYSQRSHLDISKYAAPTLEIKPMPRIIHPDWYRTPMAEDDPRMIGDYPAVPVEPYQLRDPYASDYFDVQNRRRWGEALHEDVEPMLMWSWDTEATYGWGWVLAAWGSLFGGFGLLFWWLKDVPSPFTVELERRRLATAAATSHSHKSLNDN